MTGTDEIRYCGLILTARCNLHCRYCYQNARSSRTMSWETARAAVDRFLASGSGELEFLFTGGEPLLEFPLIRRAVEYVEKHRPDEKKITFRISTNGTLIDTEIMAFLAGHRFETQISFDGVPDAQSVRGEGTYTVIDGVLTDLAERFPCHFKRRVRVAITVVPDTISHLADSVEYLVSRGVPQIVMTPAMALEESWRPERIDELDRQFRRIFDLSVEHYSRTKRVPVSIFTGRRANEECFEGGGPMCGVVSGRAVAVDAGGEAFGCSSFVPSYQAFGKGLLARSLAPLRMGRIDAPGFEESRRGYIERIRRIRMFQAKEEKYSSYGSCADCPSIAQCLVCPVSIGHIPGNEDPDRVPDFVCAFHRTELKYRAAFPSQPSLREIFTPPPELEAEMRRWRSIAGRLKTGRSVPAHDEQDHGDEKHE